MNQRLILNSRWKYFQNLCAIDTNQEYICEYVVLFLLYTNKLFTKIRLTQSNDRKRTT